GKHFMDDEVHEDHAGCLGITHLGQTHDILTTKRSMSVINLFLDIENFSLPDLDPALQDVLSTILPLRSEFAHKLQRRIHLRFENPQEPEAPLMAIKRELENKAPGYHRMVRSYLSLFLSLCCRNALENGFVSAAHHANSIEGRLESLRQYLDTHYADPHTLQSLAKRCSLSRNYLCRAFQNYVGKSVFAYLIERRIQGAMLALRSSEDKVITIALDHGFSSITHFNRTFRKIVGASPNHYRKNKNAPA
ncbi:MAG: AraC family transcriptional regulator, partial [Chthoniobacterales bacterium]